MELLFKSKLEISIIIIRFFPALSLEEEGYAPWRGHALELVFLTYFAFDQLAAKLNTKTLAFLKVTDSLLKISLFLKNHTTTKQKKRFGFAP